AGLRLPSAMRGAEVHLALVVIAVEVARHHGLPLGSLRLGALEGANVVPAVPRHAGARLDLEVALAVAEDDRVTLPGGSGLGALPQFFESGQDVGCGAHALSLIRSARRMSRRSASSSSRASSSRKTASRLWTARSARRRVCSLGRTWPWALGRSVSRLSRAPAVSPSVCVSWSRWRREARSPSPGARARRRWPGAAPPRWARRGAPADGAGRCAWPGRPLRSSSPGPIPHSG